MEHTIFYLQLNDPIRDSRKPMGVSTRGVVTTTVTLRARVTAIPRLSFLLSMRLTEKDSMVELTKISSRPSHG